MLNFSSGKVILGVREFKFVAIDERLVTAESVWTDRVVSKISLGVVLLFVVLVADVGKVEVASTKKMI